MTYIIAEVGGNHDGDLDQALTLISEASKAGANAVKFQTYNAANLVHPDTEALPQAKRAGYKTQFERFHDLQFLPKEWDLIIQTCKEWNIDFLTTPFDLESLETYKDRMKYVKISSGDLTYSRLLRAVSETGKPVILSTGMSNYEEIKEAAKFFNPAFLTVCHCVSVYPCRDEDANLNVIPKLKTMFRSVGYSDHTVGTTACLVALGMGIDVLEKHFTLDSSRTYGDHLLSVETDELAYIVNESKRIKQMLGDTKPAYPEEPQKMRRGAYAKRPIGVGQIITEEDVIELRPQKGRRPDRLIGTRATKDYKELEWM